MKILRLALPVLALTALAHCGDDETSTPDTTTTTDATTTTDTSTTDTATDETTTAPDVATETTPDTASSCDNNGFTAAAADAGPFLGAFLYLAQNTLDAPVDTLKIELVASAGGATAAGTFTITDDDYDICANCVLVYQGCDADLANCAKTFFAQSGTLTITTFGESGGQFTGTLTDVTLVEVTIDGDFKTTPVADGETWCLDSYAFDTTIQ